ncbi:hypothetical protein ABK040_014873 [Willaertia magna]
MTDNSSDQKVQMIDNFSTLPSGRNLYYLEFYNKDIQNNSANEIILFFHGSPGNRNYFTKQQTEIITKELTKENSKLQKFISIERSGFGNSTEHLEMTFLSYARDIKYFIEYELTKKIIQNKSEIKLSIVGYSAGGPFALACAYLFSSNHNDNDDTNKANNEINNDYKIINNEKRIILFNENEIKIELKSINILGGLSPRKLITDMSGMSIYNRFGYWLASYSFSVPLLKKIFEFDSQHFLKDSKKAILSDFSDCKEDLNLLQKEEEILNFFIQKTKEELIENKHYNTQSLETHLLSSEWGFELNKISKELKVNVFYGKKDSKCIVGMQQVLLKEISNVKSYEFENDGHLFYFIYLDKILDIILQ